MMGRMVMTENPLTQDLHLKWGHALTACTFFREGAWKRLWGKEMR